MTASMDDAARPGPASRWRSILGMIAVVAAFYGACDAIEWIWFRGARESDLLHLIRSIGTISLVLILVGWHLFRHQTELFPPPEVPLPASEKPPEETEDIRNYCLWFVNLRSLAAAVTLALAVVSCYVLRILPRASFVPLLLCFLVLTGFNVVLMRVTPKAMRPYQLLLLQAVIDLVLLTFLLYFAGGVENPLISLYIVHVLITSILLEKRHARGILALSCGLLASLAWVTMSTDLPHFHLALLPPAIAHRPFLAVAIAAPYAVILFATAYILSMVREHLRRTAAEREGAYEQLVRQEKMVLLGEVAAGVAHEINNPLHGVQSCLSLFKNKPDDLARAGELIALMDEGLARIALITRRLLLHSRKETLSMSETPVNDVVEESIKFVEYRARQQNTLLCSRLDPKTPRIAADPRLLSEALINLLVNALDAVEKGGTIDVDTGLSKARPGLVEIGVRDSGCGIPAENLERIFHPFFTTKAVGKGSGLGLSITKRIVEDHRGTIRVESEPGKGSRFVMTFPAYDARSSRHDLRSTKTDTDAVVRRKVIA